MWNHCNWYSINLIFFIRLSTFHPRAISKISISAGYACVIIYINCITQIIWNCTYKKSIKWTLLFLYISPLIIDVRLYNPYINAQICNFALTVYHPPGHLATSTKLTHLLNIALTRCSVLLPMTFHTELLSYRHL